MTGKVLRLPRRAPSKAKSLQSPSKYSLSAFSADAIDGFSFLIGVAKLFIGVSQISTNIPANSPLHNPYTS
ncbi:hypothetical protein QWY16_04305 [Planococcus shenhongbingii]|uniref:hypothetical protein n=1 Tax=Planococcus shenhongbingii TaxID=3058398 RepID=UPI002618E730|nr:hypothetical protein [Planococcus sp. N016]WKA59381.1 hypothetical protein QWY16_04305 [Planococcus sp. N016]